jgi:hypothetical protein
MQAGPSRLMQVGAIAYPRSILPVVPFSFFCRTKLDQHDDAPNVSGFDIPQQYRRRACKIVEARSPLPIAFARHSPDDVGQN